VLAPGAHTCSFCDSTALLRRSEESAVDSEPIIRSKSDHDEWRGELNQRLQAYRARRRKLTGNEGQSALPFDPDESVCAENVVVDIEEPEEKIAPADDFAFTIAIGRVAKEPTEPDPRLLIDVSLPPETEEKAPDLLPEALASTYQGFFPVATIDERRRALVIDALCLAFAYGGFLALFGSLGGRFTVDKLSAAVCVFTFAFVYLQYFGLFSIFGGSTPGMMVSGLQVASFTGNEPTQRQYFLRALGYMLSAGTCFLGFLWVLWDEDGLTWHDRMSQTYLTAMPSIAEEDVPHHTPAH